MGYGKDDELAINTIRLLAVRSTCPSPLRAITLADELKIVSPSIQSYNPWACEPILINSSI